MNGVLVSLVSVLLSLAILPSLTALSSSILVLGGLGKHIGPLNPLKMGIPFLVVFLGANLHSIPQSLKVSLLGIGITGSIATLIAGIPCDFPSTLTREWMAFLLGMVAAVCFFLLPIKRQKKILLFWMLCVFGSAALDFTFPKSIDWLYLNIFDPNTKKIDHEEIYGWMLTGIFGRQSLAKLVVWLPWLFFAFRASSRKIRLRENLGLLGFCASSTALALATSQRGPFLAGCLALVAFGFHQVIQAKNKKMGVIAVGSIAVVVMGVLALVPRSIIESRVQAAFGGEKTAMAAHADNNVQFRKKMLKFSWEIVATHPLGHACIPPKAFLDVGISHFNHAHNFLLQQFRERGWIWGAIHLLMWAAVFVFAWRDHSLAGSAYFAGISSIVISGMFDNHWAVINHSIILWIYLLFHCRSRLQEND